MTNVHQAQGHCKRKMETAHSPFRRFFGLSSGIQCVVVEGTEAQRVDPSGT